MQQSLRVKALRSATALVLAVSVWLPMALTATNMTARAATDPCSYANINPIPCENTQPGTPTSVSHVAGADSPTIMGFATDISVNLGGTINFKIKTSSSNYTIGIFRIGYYQGNGARQIASVTPSATLPQTQPSCLSNAAVGLLDCGNWAVSASWAVPSTAVSGLYYALLTDVSSGAFSHIPFIVRNDASHSDIVFKTNDTTWEAYNDYGGNSLYYGTTGSGCGAFNQYTCGRAYKVSYNRPFNDENEGTGYGTSNYLWYAEYPMIRWLESNGYNVSYVSDIDVERAASLLRNHNVILMSGHDEYWSAGERTALEQARDAGVSIASFTGNTAFWKTRWENSTDGSNTPYRTLVTYKETLDNKVEDPADPPTWTGTWRDPRFSPPADGGRPENALLGTIFMVDRGSAAPVISSSFAKLRFWHNTAVASLTGSQTVTLGNQVIGYEWDEDLDNGFRPAGLFDMAATSVNVPELLQDYGNTYTPGTAIWSPTLYRAASGALVFSSGTVQWAWGLDVHHDINPDNGPSAPDLNMEQATVNLLADMQAQPATLQSGLVAATASTDTTAPSSTITSPTAGTTVNSDTATTISGTATDAGGGVVAGIEISTDGGSTWNKATITGAAATTISWSYSWTPETLGSVTIKSRAVDDSSNLESPSAGVTVTVRQRTCPCTLFESTDTPAVVTAQDSSAVELGMKFKADVNGTVSGVRFYKGPSNTGTHVGNLWSSSGTLLATVTFSGETASGWQQATFSTPVAITAGTVYVVSYHTNVGNYSASPAYFETSADNAPLHGVANGTSANGVYSYGGTQFPTSSYNATNYWVDVVFTTSAGTTPVVTSTNPSSGATGVAPGVAPTATFNENVTAASITFTLTGPNNSAVAGTVSYNSATFTATFTPTSALAAGTSYTATVSGATDASGHTMASPYTWTFTTANAITCPCSLFAPSATPAVASANDSSAVELGMKFTADTNGYITSVRFYKGPSNTGTHVGNLWSSSGTLLATVTFSGETASGWQQANFSTPVAVTAGTVYVVSYHTNTSGYSYTSSGFSTSVDNAPLHGVANGTSVNGVYSYGGTQFPTSSFGATNYWVDVVFTTQSGGSTTPAVTSTNPAAGATGVAPGVAPTATFNENVTAASITFTLTGPNNSAVAGTVSYNSATFTATFTPTSALAAGTSYTATVSGATDAAGHTMTAPFTWSFTTANASSCPCYLFSPSATPATVTVQDSSAVELGMKFKADVNGTVSGVRFYKGSQNTGTHVGNLWSSTGTLLATVTFSGETASGWQQANFSIPVAITAGTVYVVSYHTNVGFYSASGGYFSTAADNAPLHGVANGTSANGVYSYGGTQFPTSSYNATNYWVDVVFSPS